MWFCRDPRPNDFVNDYRANAELAALARSAADLGDLPSRDCWRRVEPNPKIAGWTDDYSDILRAILRRKSGHDALPALSASAARQ